MRTVHFLSYDANCSACYFINTNVVEFLAAMTSEQFDQMCRDICPHCNAGIVARQREDTLEWVHDSVFGPRGVTAGHSICLATHWRNKKLGAG